ncbi:Glutamyl-tRNA synthetase [Candidatus Purcelliella pentastirinorum]|uniref:Glutamate--tRNA ligase n=1 Tax=Candidatus Purcelliella pentastirinorum TaxID=472834 RepID=A0A346DZJ6_9ENTR|nr:glutamate--tRNA ligase [Candidatus Purcelliella pentastirinorum]AXN02151.1 Glutamyl-tRNA synthetase [Candidatus Purcelliella pentastirinorum]
MKIKTRFAPSPTGSLHLGGARTALYSWLFAQKHNGSFILRFEDTNKKNSKKYFVKEIIKNMKWMGLNWNKNIYFQSQRIKKYNKIIKKMLINKKAYKCYCSKERLKNLKKYQLKNKIKPRYDNLCRYNKKKLKKNKYVIRFKNPEFGEVVFKDQIRGKIKIKNKELDDLIIQRSNGIPTYNFCVAIDDWDMKITHVIRGEEHISNTPKQINILHAIGIKPPIYAHLPIILNENGEKMSKRKNTKSIFEYKKNGYLPEALLNYLIRLGWSHGNKEIFNITEMKELFNLKKVNKSASLLNNNKLKWLNQHYLKNLNEKIIIKNFKNYIKLNKIRLNNLEIEILKIFIPRCKTFKEIIKQSNYLYKNIKLKKNDYLCKNSIKPLKYIKKEFSSIKIWNESNIQLKINKIIEKLKLNIIDLNMPLRISITGQTKSPNLSLIISLLGKHKALERIENSIKYINKNKIY